MRVWATLLVSALLACPVLADEIKMREFSVGLTAGTEDGYRGIQGRLGYFGLRVGQVDTETTVTLGGDTVATLGYTQPPCPPWPPHAKGIGPCKPGPEPGPQPQPEPRRTVVSEEDAIAVELMGYFPLLKGASECYVGDAPEDRDVTCRLSGVATVGLIEGGDLLGSIGVEYVTRFGLVGGIGLSNEAGVLCNLGYGFTWGKR